MPEAYKTKIEAAWPQTSQTARENFGVEMTSHRLGVDSRLALEGAKFAEEKGVGEAYHEAMFKAHFQEDRDFGNLETLAELAQEVGLDPCHANAAVCVGMFGVRIQATWPPRQTTGDAAMAPNAARPENPPTKLTRTLWVGDPVEPRPSLTVLFRPFLSPVAVWYGHTHLQGELACET